MLQLLTLEVLYFHLSLRVIQTYEILTLKCAKKNILNQILSKNGIESVSL